VAVAAGSPTRGGTLQVAHIGNISSIDPHQVTAGFDLHILYAVFDPIVDTDPQMKPVPALAESWSQPKPTTWEFKLRKGVSFHDGTPWNAAAMKFNIERVLDPATKSTQQSLFQVIKQIEVVDDYTIHLSTEAPNATLPILLAGRGGLANSPDAVKKAGKDYGVTTAVGTGPFKLIEWKQGSSVTLDKNPAYFRQGLDGKPLPYLDKIVFNIVQDPTVRVTNLKAKAVDITYDVAPKDFPGFGTDPEFVAMKAPQTAVYMDYISTSRPPFDNIHARLAYSYAIDRTAIAKIVWGDLALPANGVISPALGLYYDPSQPVIKQDLEKAKDELKQAGMPDGFEMTSYNVPGEIYETQAQAQQAMVAKVGIKLNVQTSDDPTISGYLANNSDPWQMNSDMTPGRPDPDILFSNFYYPGAGYNKGRLLGPGIDQVKTLVDQGRGEFDDTKRVALYRQVNMILERDAYDFHLYFPLQTAAMTKRVKGFVQYGDSFVGHAWKDVWLEG